MDEGGVDDRVHGRGAALKATRVLERAAVHLGPRGSERPGAGIGAREAEDAMARPEKLMNDGRSDEPCGASDEYVHIFSPLNDL